MEQKIWWYSLNNEQKGPVTQDELNLLTNQNFINQSTLVWKQGLQSWIKFSDINAPVDTAPQGPPPPPAFSQPIANQPQSANGNYQQNPVYSQPGPGYSQPNPQQNFQPNNSQPAFNSQATTASPNPLSFVTDFFYRAEFEKIMNSNESYKGKWNWYSFFFSWIWCFTKGLWQYAVLALIPTFILPYFAPLLVTQLYSLGVAILFGMRGTWFYYNLKMKGKQVF